jgi:NADP-dependent 3-hydroxy acid dehydrogenase YdfG
MSGDKMSDPLAIIGGAGAGLANRALHRMDPARMMKPADIARTYLALADQPRSTWTHELDLGPMGEAF